MSKKNFTDSLSAWVQAKEATRMRQDKCTVAFLGVRSDVADALEAGYTIKTIWEYLCETGRINYGYEAFRKHVRKHIGYAHQQPKATNNGEPKKGTTNNPRTKPAAAAKARGFSFNPNPDKGELI